MSGATSVLPAPINVFELPTEPAELPPDDPQAATASDAPAASATPPIRLFLI
jgi:hypothetical protein